MITSITIKQYRVMFSFSFNLTFVLLSKQVNPRAKSTVKHRVSPCQLHIYVLDWKKKVWSLRGQPSQYDNHHIQIIFYAGIFGWEDTQLTTLVLLYITMFENGHKLLTVNHCHICQLDINWRPFIFQVTFLQN